MNLILRLGVLTGLCAGLVPAAALAQQGGEVERSVRIAPYIEVSQVLSAELSPGDDVVTFTQIAAGVDLNRQSRNSGTSVSVRYERNIGYGDRVDTDTVSGIARGYLAVVPRTVNFEAGALASRTRIDGGGAVSANPLVSEDASSQIYSLFAGPTLTTRLGDLDVSGLARIGYNRFETDNTVLNTAGDPIDVFGDSTSYTGQIKAGTRVGRPLPVGLSATAGFYQEDISNLDQRVRDVFVRGDVTIPITPSLAVVAGAGYEDVEVSSRDALRDVDGNPILGSDGRLITDTAAPRQIAFEVDGLLWDVGVMWRPSSRTSLAASVGERYGSTTYYGNFSYAPDRRSSLNISVYDAISGFGGQLGNSLAGLSSDFSAVRNPVTGDFTGLVTGTDGSSLVNSLGSVRSAAFRGQGVNASYQRQIGRLTAAFGAGYDRREFIGAEGTVLEIADGIVDESYYINGGISRQVGQRASIAASAYINWFDTNAGNSGATGFGVAAAYNRSITDRLSARAAIAVDYLDSDFTAEDFAVATALLGLRYDF